LNPESYLSAESADSFELYLSAESAKSADNFTFSD